MATPVSNSALPPAPSDNGTLTDEFIAGLVQGSSWTFGAAPRLLTYSFSLGDGTVVTGSYAWSPELRDAFVLATAAWSSVADISFQESGSGGLLHQSSADLAITLTGSELSAEGAAALGFFPDPVFVDDVLAGLAEFGISRANYPRPEGDIFFDHLYSAFFNLNAGGLGLEIMIHELGHALGLNHPIDVSVPRPNDFNNLGISQFDASRYTVMTAGIAGGSESSGNAATPMPLDILAIQQIYGPNTTFHAGNDSYVVSLDGAMRTLWDAGGTDTLDASALFGVTIDLRPGAIMDFGPGTVLALAYDDFMPGVAVIENAIGGSGDDALYGNNAANLLSGGSGGDRMFGSAGNDTYVVTGAGDKAIEYTVLERARASIAADGTQGNADSLRMALSGDGSKVLFVSPASTLVPDDTGGTTDLFLKDLQTGAIARVNTTADGTRINLADPHYAFAMTQDARYIAFSTFSNLLPGDGNVSAIDVYRKDLQTGALTLVSRDAGGGAVPHNVEEVGDIQISADGRVVAFAMTQGAQQVWVKDLQTGALTLASSDSAGDAALGWSFDYSLSANGRYVAFSTIAGTSAGAGNPPLDPASVDTNGVSDVYLKDLQTGTTTRVSGDAFGGQGASVSADGRYVAFQANNSLYVKDLPSGSINLAVSSVPGAAPTNARLSDDGRFLSFMMYDSGLVPGDSNQQIDAFVKDLQTGQLARVSTGPDGAQANGGGVQFLDMSADGGYIGVGTTASNLVAGDSNGLYDVYAFANPLTAPAWGTGDTGGTDTVQSSISYLLGTSLENLTLTGNDAIDGTGNALANTITGNAAANRLDGGAGADLMIGGAGDDVYIVDDAGDQASEGSAAGTDTVRAAASFTLQADVESLVLTGSANLQGIGNGLDNFIFGNGGANLLDGGAGADTLNGGAGNDIYVVDNAGDKVLESMRAFELASSTAGGAQANGSSSGAAIADGGRFVAFGSFAGNLVGGAGSSQNVFVKDLQSGEIVLASGAPGGTASNSNSSGGALSAEGRYVAFESQASNLVAGDSNGFADVFVKDLQTGVLTRVSTASGGSQGGSVSGGGDISADGRYVAFYSLASDLVAGDVNGFSDIFVKDLQTGATTLVSTSTGGLQASGSSNSAVISADGRYVVFQSAASNLVAGDTNGAADLFRKDLLTGETLLVSAASDGAIPTLAENPGFFQLNGSTLGGVSGDGRYVVFNSLADNLVAGDTNHQIDVFLKDMQTGVTARVSTGSGGVQASNGSNGSGISASGRYALFDSISNDLDPADTDSSFDVYVKDLQTGLTALISGPASGPKQSNLSVGYSLSADGSAVVFHSFASNLVVGDANGTGDVFVAQNPLFDPGGRDFVKSSITWTLAANVEELQLTGTSPINGTGNSANNWMQGNSAANVLDGGAGNDALLGGGGNDTYIVDSAGDSTIENASAGQDFVKSSITWTLAANVEELQLMGTSPISGTGNALNNWMQGNGAANVLDGGAGNDAMLGGGGNDTYVVDSTGDSTIENAGAGQDFVKSSITWTLAANVEELQLTGSNPLNGTGNSANNWMAGNGAANVLDGGAGNDAMLGGGGNDTYVVDSTGDSTIENPGAGQDFVKSSISWTLAANVEELQLTGSNPLNGTGNSANNWMAGNSAANMLDGGAGNDALLGGGGNDTYIVDSAGDSTIENASAGQDFVKSSIMWTLAANVEELQLTGTNPINGTGNALNNWMAGNGAANVLDGGAGNDALIGGAGADTYQFSSALGAANIDQVVGFSVADDTIQLKNTIFTSLGTAGPLVAGRFISGPGLTTSADATESGADDYLIYDTASGFLYYDADGSDPGASQHFATLVGAPAITEGEFFVV